LLSLEPLLRAKLESLGLFKAVWGLADLNAEKAKPTPCAYVVYDGAQVAQTNAAGAEAKIVARWLVALAVKNAARAGDGAAAREDARPLADAVLAALMGWRPDAAHQPLVLADLPRPEAAAGLIYLPLVFTTTQIIK